MMGEPDVIWIYFCLNETMGKKITDKRSKKRIVNKSLRSKILKKTSKTKTSQQQQQPTVNQPSLINQPQMNTPLRGMPLRDQLLMRSMNPFGFGAQQYGNINNERRIDQLKNDNQAIAQEINGYKVTIEAMKKEQEERKKERKAMKKELKKHEMDQQKSAAEIEVLHQQLVNAKYDLEHKKKVDLEKENLEKQLNNLNDEMAEMPNEVNNLAMKKQIDEAERMVKAKQKQVDHFKNIVEANPGQQKLRELTKRGEDLDVELGNYMALFRSDVYHFSNDEIEKRFVENERKRFQIEVCKAAYEREWENQLKIRKMGATDIDSLMKNTVQLVQSAKNMNKDLEAIQYQISRDEEAIEDNKHARDQYMKAKYAAADESIEAAKEDAKVSAMNEMMPKEQLQSDLLSEAKSVGVQQAKTFKSKSMADSAKQKFNLKVNAATNSGYNDEMEKDLDEDLFKIAKEAGKIQAENESQRELAQSIKSRRREMFNEVKAESRNHFMNSPEMQSIQEEIIENERQAAVNQQETDQRDLLHKTQVKLQETAISNEISKSTIDNGASEVDQVNFIVDHELQPRMNDIKAKQTVYETIVSEMSQYPSEWNSFIQENPQVDDHLGTGNWKNQSIDQLREILQRFRSFRKRPQQQEPLSPLMYLQSTPPQQIHSVNVNGNEVAVSDLPTTNDVDGFVEEEEE